MPNYKNAPKEINPHYNREFELLMSGEKEIAVFSTAFFADSDWPDERYEDAVNHGLLQREVFHETYRNRKIETVYYFLPNRAELVSRIESLYEKLQEASGAIAKNIETEIGQLLGYQKNETVTWIEFFGIGEESKMNPLIGPHEGQELELMLKREKPAAQFSDFADPVTGKAKLLEWTDEEFKPHVDNNEILRYEYFQRREDENPDLQIVHRLFFALPEEEWRIKELFEMSQKKYNFSDAKAAEYETRIGSLLGYPKEAIDFYVKRIEKMRV